MACVMTCKNFIVYLIVVRENLSIYFPKRMTKRIIVGDKNIRGVSRKCSLCNSDRGDKRESILTCQLISTWHITVARSITKPLYCLIRRRRD